MKRIIILLYFLSILFVSRSQTIGYVYDIDSVPIEIESNEHNKFYLETKRDKMGHSLKNLDE